MNGDVVRRERIEARLHYLKRICTGGNGTEDVLASRSGHVLVTMPESLFVIVTVACGITAPDASVTMPRESAGIDLGSKLVQTERRQSKQCKWEQCFQGISASKAAVAALTQSTAIELAPYGITTNAITPGIFPTELNKRLLATSRGEELLIRTPMKRFGSPEELVSTAVYLALEQTSFTTGQMISVDGGFMASGVKQWPQQIASSCQTYSTMPVDPNGHAWMKITNARLI